MDKRLCVLAFLVVSVAGCQSLVSSVRVSGSTDDGEAFTGTMDDTEAYGTSGPVELTTNRGTKCMGRHKYSGIIGPGGTVSFMCNDGRTGEGTLDGNWGGGTGRGTIAGKPFTMKLGS